MTPFCPIDMQFAHENFNAMCGHGALAAALEIDVHHAMKYFDKGGWVNIPIMKAAIRKAGHQCIKRPGPFRPVSTGVAMVQFLGSWMNEGVPIAARCAHRHWIAFKDGAVWDSNTELWMYLDEWEKLVPALYSPKTTGHAIESTFVIV